MRPIRTTTALVLSRIRHDRKRHLAAIAAVAVLMASFLAFNAYATGMEEGLRHALEEGEHHRIHLILSGFGATRTMDEATFQEYATSPGVEAASPRSGKSVGLEHQSRPGPGRINVTSEIILLGLDPRVEEALVVAGGLDAAPAPFTRGGGYQGRNHTLIAGNWIQGPGDAVATQAAAQAGYGIGATVTTPEASYTIVGVIASAPPLTVPGIIPAGHILVDHATQSWPSIQGGFFELEPDFATIHAFASRIVADHPAATTSLRGTLVELERQYYEGARSQQVLAAASRLVAVAGAATVFAMSLFLLAGERKAFGTMAALGFARGRLAVYMNQKMAVLAMAGAAGGALFGWLAVAALPVPAVSFSFMAVIDGATVVRAALQTLGAALAGGLLAFFLTIRQDPIPALRATE